jgi:hypothetical protein
MASMPNSVRPAWRIGGNAKMMLPSAAACWLMSALNAPVRRESWKLSDSRSQCANRSLRRSSTMFCSSFALIQSMTTVMPLVRTVSPNIATTAKMSTA